MDNEAARINTFKNILRINNSDYSKVMTLEELLTEIKKANNYVRINYDYIVTDFESNKQIVAFKSFTAKSVICFLTFPGFSEFLTIVRSLTEIKINSNAKLYDLLSKSLTALQEREGASKGSHSSSVYSNVQMVAKGETLNEKNILKNYTNRFLVNCKNFEILRLVVGDCIFSYFLQWTALFAFEDKIQNYIQVLGVNLKTRLLDLMGASGMEKSLAGPSSSNLYSYRNTKTNQNVVGLSNEAEKKIIPNQSFEVGRTKIFYCPNFNRRLGFFKSTFTKKINKKGKDVFNLNKRDNFFHKLFSEQHLNLIPVNLQEKMKAYMNRIFDSIHSFDYPKWLFLSCQLPKEWKEKKKEITAKIKKGCKAEEFNENLEFLLNQTIDYSSIFKFIVLFLSKIIPIDFIGVSNFNVIKQKIKIFVEMNRFESFNKVSLFDLKEFSFKEMKWLQFEGMRKDTYEIFGIKLKNFIMKNIIFFIFDSLIISLLRSHFYVTERQGHNYKSFYYHKGVWDLIAKINEIKLSAQFELISDPKAVTKWDKRRRNKEMALDIMKNYDLAPGKLRPMPKPTTCRPIVSYKRKTLKTNSVLKNEFFETQKVFKYISTKMQTKSDNCVVFDHKTIVDKLKAFKKVLNVNSFSNETVSNFLKYCTMDIEACYDNINIEKLNSILDSDDIIPDVFVPHVLFVVLPKPHMLKKVKWKCETKINNGSNNNKTSFTNYNTCNNSTEVCFADCFEVKKLYFASDSNEYLHFLDYLQNKSDLNYSHCIIYQSPEKRNYIRKENFMYRVKAILNNNIIKFNKKFFRQRKGIPQGLSVSSFLCNLYFYNIEKSLSKKVNAKEKTNQLLRFMDDYLCITSDNRTVYDFLNESDKLAKENVFKFNTKKSKSNVKFSEEGECTNLIKDSFSWNGINFEVNKESHFNIYIDAKEDYDIKRFSNLINVNLPISDSSWLFKKINGIFLTGNPWIYFIPTINAPDALNKNFEDFCKVVAYKLIVLTHVMIKSNIQPGQNTFIDIMDSCLKKLFFYFNNKILRNDNSKFFLDFSQFNEIFYSRIFKIYEVKDEVTKELIDYSPFFFKSIRRKILRMQKRKANAKYDEMIVDA